MSLDKKVFIKHTGSDNVKLVNLNVISRKFEETICVLKI